MAVNKKLYQPLDEEEKELMEPLGSFADFARDFFKDSCYNNKKMM